MLDLNMDIVDVKAFDMLTYFLRSTPNLVALKIEVGDCNVPGWDSNAIPEDYWETLEPFSCLDDSLLDIDICGMDLNCVHLVRLATFMLRNACVLEQMFISYYCDSAVQPEVLNLLTLVDMASVDAELNFQLMNRVD